MDGLLVAAVPHLAQRNAVGRKWIEGVVTPRRRDAAEG